MGRTNVRVCRYLRCGHSTLEIDTETEPFEKEGTNYYHKDCFVKMQEEREKRERTRNDLIYIRDQWASRVSDQVAYSYLMKVLNDLVDDGFSSDYLVFAFDYVTNRQMNLRYPGGFPYFVRRQDVKDAYRKRNQKKPIPVKVEKFQASEESDAPTFQLKQKPVGFGILESGLKGGT